MAAGAGSIRAGRAFVELAADDTKLRAGLAKAKQQTSKFAQEVSRVGTGAGAATASIGGLGAIGSFASSSFGATATAGIAAVATVNKLAEAETRKLNLALEETARLNQEIAASAERRFQKGLENSRGITDPAARQKALEEQLKQAEKNLEGTGRNAAAANEEVRKLGGGWNLLIEQIPVWSSALEAERTAAKATADEQNASLAAQRERVRQLREEMQQFRKQWFDNLMKPIQDLNRELDLQTKTLNMSADEAKLYRLEQQLLAAGLKDTDSVLADTRAKMAQLRDAINLKGAKDDLAAFTAELKGQIALWDKSAEAIRLAKIEASGFGLDTAEARGLVEFIEATKAAEKKRQEDAAKKAPTAEIMQTVKGAFGGSNLAQQFGVGSRINEKQLREAAETNRKLNTVVKVLQAIQRKPGLSIS